MRARDRIREVDPGLALSEGALVMSTGTIKPEARRLLESLPDDATWDDFMHLIYVRQAVESGLDDSRAGRTADVKAVREKFGLAR